MRSNGKNVNRHVKSWRAANIILQYDLVNEFKIFCWTHPKIKSKYRAGNLFLIHRKLLYADLNINIPVNMDTLIDYYNADIVSKAFSESRIW